jgi:serine-type D-Ala-D-Ala carboxypeptidase (penicillin-binding protein 5/6)
MRVPAGLLSAAAVTGLLAAGLTAAAPAASAATTAKTVTTVNTVTAAKAITTANAGAPAGVRAPWAELENAATGADLWSRSSVSERPMGSITKVMTAYVVIEAGGLNRVVTVPKGIVAYDKKYDASTAGLVPGEKLTVLQLLYAMMLPSGCDAAYTLATSYGPGFNAFVTAMNATARKLGLTKTHFSDPSGLPNPSEYTNYSTARDLISLGRDAMKLAVFRQVVATRTYRVAAGAGHRAHTWKNLNQLLTSYSGAIGIKTGFTAVAGECLLFEARRGAATLIGVVLHSAATESASDQAAPVRDATAMLNWGFSR